jgi:hypothetical protein
MRTLFVGKPRPQDVAMLTRMGRRGWGSYSADNLSEARMLIEGGGFDLVLALQALPEGSGYELIAAVAEREGSLFVGIDLLRDRLWIPVVEHGERVFGDRAVHADSVEAEWEHVLRVAAEEETEDGKRKSEWRATASDDIGYAPIQIQLDPACGAAGQPAQPRPSRISAIARLQLRCAGFGLLRAGKGRDAVEHFDKTIAGVAAGRRQGPVRSIAGMHSRGRRD